MSKFFSRNRTTSTATPPATTTATVTDEFGRVTSRGSALGVPPTNKKDKKGRQRTLSSPHDRPISEHPDTLPDGVFLPTSLVSPHPTQDPDQLPKGPEQLYGYLSAENHVVLGLDDLSRLVDVVTSELGSQGLATPLLFSSLALDVSPPLIRRVIAAFLRTCTNPQAQDAKWREEARFAGAHELAMVLRWGLARVIRMERGFEVHGLLDWDLYIAWRTAEQASNYPLDHFSTFLPGVQPNIRKILTTLLDLLTRLVAHSTSSGLTPPTLASLFGPILFGLGNFSQGAFSLAYTLFLRSANATEHLLLAYIRYQESQATVASTVPARLRDWTRGYPSMIPAVEKLERARRGARTVRLASVRRNVRLYSPDLVKTAASWASGGDALASSKEWSRIVPPSMKLSPRYSDHYRKRMDIPLNFHPDMGPGVAASSSSSTTGTISSISTLSPSDSELGMSEDEHRFRSLTDLKWGTFESIGFSSGDESKLEFDLNEGARKVRGEKRATLSWTDFSSAGFTRTDAPLSATLQFSAPLVNSITQWPSQSAELQRKLKKAQKALPAFGWDTNPVLGSEEVVEEAFMDCFCDLIYGTGWMDRSELTFRDCNWALVEFKSLPTQRSTLAPQGDPRTGTTLLLFEEFVPLEYRAQLSAPKKKTRFFLSPASKAKPWKPAPTLNGRPYVIGTVPKSPNSQKEVEFEGLLRGGGDVTKVISLQRFPQPAPQLSPPPVDPAAAFPSPLPTPKAEKQILPVPTIQVQPSPSITPSKTLGRFRLGSSKRAGMVYDAAIDFETRTESFSEGEGSDTGEPGSTARKVEMLSGKARDHTRRQSKDDAWVDILVADHNRRYEGQSAELKSKGVRKTKHSNHSDPELAREEIAKALASIGKRPPDDDDDLFRAEPLGVDERAFHPRQSVDSEDDYHPEAPSINLRPPTVISVPTSSNRPHSPESADFQPIPGMQSQMEEEEDVLSVNDPHGLLASPIGVKPSPTPPASSSREITPTSTPAPTSTAPSKPGKLAVSSLIEMYRERERNGNGGEDRKPSRLPVRTPTSNVGNSSPSVVTSNGPGLTSSNLSTKDAAKSTTTNNSNNPMPAPVIAIGPELGRISPARYVHGAPLHNVAEEEEEP